MVAIDEKRREINCKIVYYGAGMSGKTTNLQHIYAHTNPHLKGRLLSLDTPQERTIFFDFLPLSLGRIRGYQIRLHLYSVPGQIFYDPARKLILQGVDGVVFVVDSQYKRMDANWVSYDNLWTNLQAIKTSHPVPWILQYNKRDTLDIAAVSELQSLFNPQKVDFVEACAKEGKGVFETLKIIGKLVLKSVGNIPIASSFFG